jgi:hypothetical protein
VSNQPLVMPLEKAKLRPGTDESKCDKVAFPNGKLYLLPIPARAKKFIPRFTADGVVLDVLDEDPLVGVLIEKFLELMATVEKGEVWIRTEEAYEDFFQLIRTLIIKNYDYTTEELTALLTLTSAQLSQLCEEMFRLILRP